MTRLTALWLSVPPLGLALALAACGGGSTDLSAESVLAVSASGSGITVNVLPTNSVNGGFIGAVRIADTAFPSPITSFEIGFRLGGAASVAGSAWNGNITTADASGTRTATSPDWLQFKPIQVGQTWEVGFNGSGAFAGSTIMSMRINGTIIVLTPDEPKDPPLPGGTPPPPPPPPPPNVFRVNPDGRITRNGQVFPVHCGAWLGLEGRHESSNDPTNPSGAPMELLMGNTLWANGGAGTGRTVAGDMAEIAAAGINMIRVPVVPQTLKANDPQGRAPFLKNHPSVRVAYSLLALQQVIIAAAQNNIQVLLDMHSCSNYVGWRKGRLDARPPYVDRDRENYDFKRENFSCSATNNPSTVTTIHAYNENLWLNDLRTLAGLGQQLGVDNIIGIDIFNEPWDYTWAEWKTLTEHAYQAINAVNPNTLVFVQGISGTAGNQDGTPTTITQVPFGNAATNPNWGENLFEAGANPPNVPKDRIVFSPHTYGPSVFVQRQFMDPAQPACAGLEGDAAGNARCNVVINPTLLRNGWEEHFGYLKGLGYAVVVGEFGGNLDWPGGQASLRDRARWGYLAPGTDAQWQNAFVDYMKSKGIEGCYWSINPESGDTAGWYSHAFDPVSNTAGWGEWRPFDARKTTLLNRLWGP